MFDHERYVSAVLKQEKEELRGFFHEEALVFWPCSNEQFTLEEYLRANCEYPGDWDGAIEMIKETDDGIVLVIQVYPKDRSASFHCVSFLTLKEEKISRLTEYWADDSEAPEWRQEMGIGRKIR